MTPRLDRIVLTLVAVFGVGVTAYNLLTLRRFEIIAFTATVVIGGAVLLRDYLKSRRAGKDDARR
ncbi:MAG: hypothetical protein JNJ73_16600 [Hyphomonadaceae bacterium]|nr:hypothetical protein [Hyphomonadaceae bacterium]